MRISALARLATVLVLSLALTACGSDEAKPRPKDDVVLKSSPSTKIVFPERVGDFVKVGDDAPMVTTARESLAASDPSGEMHAEIAFYERGTETFQLLGSNPPPGSELYRGLQRSPQKSIEFAMSAVPVTGAQSYDTKATGLVLECGTLAEDHAQMCVWADGTSLAQLMMAGVGSPDAAAELARLFIKHVRVVS